MERQIEKFVTLEGASYKLEKFTPQTACYWAGKLGGKALMAAAPVIAAMLVKQKNVSIQSVIKPEEIIPLIAEFVNMPKAEFIEFQNDCLASVSKQYGNLWHPVLNVEGSIDPSLDAPSVMNLTIQSFMFSMQDFFAKWLPTVAPEAFTKDAATDSEKQEQTSNSSTGSPSESTTGNSVNSGTGPIG